MTSHHLTIAKATFAASLLRPDVTKVSRDEIPHFHQLLETAVLKCTPSNVQTCKQWLLNHIIPSQQRSAALGKYLSSYSKYITAPEHNRDGPSVSRQRLHLIYLLNDTFHHANYHNARASSDPILPFLPFLPDLFRHAASEKRPSICKRLDDLVEIWQQQGHVSHEHLSTLRTTISNPTSTSVDAAQAPSTAPKELPFMMPLSHGDSSLPFYELPAGNLMPHIIPNKTISMRPDAIRPLQFASGSADEELVKVVKDFLKDVERIHDASLMEADNIVAEIDDLGQISYRNESGDVTGETYYGWSKSFCARMKSRRNEKKGGSAHRNGSPRYSSSRSPSPASSRKRRYSPSSDDQSRSRSRSRYRARRSPVRELRPQSPQYGPGLTLAVEAVPLASNSQGHPSSWAATRTSQVSAVHAPFPPPPVMPGNVPIPPPRPPQWPAGNPWPPPPPPSAIGAGVYPPMPFPPASFGMSHPAPGFPPNSGPHYYQNR